MSAHSSIEWTDATWPIVQGCDPVSPGCANCYAIKVVHRLAWSSNPKISAPLKGVVEYHKDALRWSGKVALREDRLDWPLKWKKGRMIFVPSHGDIFHKDVPDEFLDRIFAVMALCPKHVFQVLTKRAPRMREYCISRVEPKERLRIAGSMNMMGAGANHPIGLRGWPLSNIWLGVSAEDQVTADERIPLLINTPAAVRFVSLEPLLGPITLWYTDEDKGALRGPGIKIGGGMTASAPDNPPEGYDDSDPWLDWVIVGGESGPKARPMHPDWARSIRDQCTAASVPFFMKQWGEWKPLNQKDGGPWHGAHGVISHDGRFLLDHDIADPPKRVFTVRWGVFTTRIAA